MINPKNFAAGTLGQQFVDRLRPKWRGTGVPIEAIVEDILAIIENDEIDVSGRENELEKKIGGLEESLSTCTEERADALYKLMKIEEVIDGKR